MANWLGKLGAKRAPFRHALSAALALLALTGVAIAHFKDARIPTKNSAIVQDTAAAVSSFQFNDQRGVPVNNASLNGHVWIADFIFTTCTSACPLITSRFVTLQRRLTDERLRFVSFSVDPERDSASALAQYAARWAPAESRWQLLHTSNAGLGPLLAGLHVAVDRDQGEIIHTSRLFLVNAAGALVASFDSADDSALDQLVGRTRELLGTPNASQSTLSGTGAQLFESLGCAGCHADPQLAPPLGGLAGGHLMLEQAGSVAITDAYLTESIANPGSKLVAGYPNSMPNYGALLSPDQVQSLVAHVRTLPALPSADSAASTAQTDPVCGMSVRVTPQTPAADYHGKTYHFCSPACAQRFTSDPQKYLGAKRPLP